MLINRQTVRCDVKDCGEEYSIQENVAWNMKTSFINLPNKWVNFVGYKNLVSFYGSYYICPRHEVEVRVDGEILE